MHSYSWCIKKKNTYVKGEYINIVKAGNKLSFYINYDNYICLHVSLDV